MEFKLNKLTLLLLSAPLIANASITHNGTNVLPSGLATSITDNQEHTINGFLTIAEGGKTTPEGQANGEMTIDNGSKLNISGTVMIGNQNNDGFGGKLTVTGAGSELNVGGLLNIGNYSNANLSILEGGKVTSTFPGNGDDPHFWGWLRHKPDGRTAINTKIIIDGEGSELSYHKDSLIRVVGGGHKETNVDVLISNGGKLSTGVLQLENGTANIQIGNKGKGGTLDVRGFAIGLTKPTFTFDQNDELNFTPEIYTVVAKESYANFVQSGTGTTLFAPTSMRGVNSKIDITDGTLKVGRDNVFFGAGTKTNEINIGSKGTLALNGHNADALTVNNEGTIRLASDDESANKTLRVLDYTS